MMHTYWLRLMGGRQWLSNTLGVTGREYTNMESATCRGRKAILIREVAVEASAVEAGATGYDIFPSGFAVLVIPSSLFLPSPRDRESSLRHVSQFSSSY